MMQDQQSNEALFSEPACDVCKSQDPSLRAVIYPFVVSVVVMTFQRAFSGIYCAKHQRRYHFLASLITATVGWLGIPFGLIMTPITLFRLAKGGIVNNEYSSNILQHIAEKKLRMGDSQGAIRCLEQALKLQDDPLTRERLGRLYQQAHSDADRNAVQQIWQLVAAPVLIALVTIVGFVLGLFDSIVVWLLTPLFGGEITIIFAIISWLPTVLLLFIGILFVRALLRWSLQKAANTSILLGSLLSFAATGSFFYGFLEGKAIVWNIQGLVAFFSISIHDGIFALRSVLTHGGLDLVINDLQLGQLSGIISTVLLGTSILLSLSVGIETILHTAQWQNRLSQVSPLRPGDSGQSSIVSWLTFSFLMLGLGATTLLIYPGRYVNMEKAFEQLNQGITELERNDPQAAMGHFQQLSSAWPDSVTAHTYLGIGHSYQGDIDQALAELDAGLALDPNSTVAHLFRGYTISAQGKFLEAVSEFQIVSASQSQWGLPYAFLAILHYNLDEDALAQREIEKAIELQAEDGQTISMIGSYYLGISDFKEAERYYLKAIQIENNPQDHLTLARIYSSQGKYEEAEKSIDEADQLGADPANVYVAKSGLALLENDLGHADSLMSYAIVLFPTRSDVWAEMSFIHFKQGKIDDAISDANKALEFNPYNSVAYVELAFALHEHGKVKESMEAARQAILLYPKYDRVHYILGLCYMDSGMKAEAIQEFETFLKLYWDRPLVREYKQHAEVLLEQLK